MIRSEVRDRVAIVTIDNPPVNALPVAGWFQLADAVRTAGHDPGVHVVILRAEGKGFQAGVDIKELAADDTKQSLIGVNRGCFEAFAAVYDCEVPVIAAVQGFCVGGGIGLAGSADIVVASDDATFGLPEVDRGALGGATHFGRLVPQHKLRALFFTGATITAAELLAFGTVERVVPREQLFDTALELAETIAAKSTLVIRRAKESLNMIDPVDVKRSYRFEQGFTFELNLFGDSDELRQAFVDKRRRPRRTLARPHGARLAARLPVERSGELVDEVGTPLVLVQAGPAAGWNEYSSARRWASVVFGDERWSR